MSDADTPTRGRWAFRAALLVLVAPLYVSAVRNGLRHWVPAADPGVTTIRINDVFSAHPPLIGMASSASQWAGREISFIGAFQLYLLALPVKLLGTTWGVLLGVATLNSAALVAAAWLVRRRVGYVGAVVGCAFFASLVWSVGPQVIVDVTPMQIGVIPFVLLLVAAWSVADGDAAGLVVLAVIANYLFVDHLTFTASVPIVCVAALALWAWHLRRSARADPERWPGLRRRHLRAVAAAAAVTVVIWIPPLYQQVHYPDGNLGNLVKASRADRPRTPTAVEAGRVVVAAVAVPRFWLRPTFRHPTFHADSKGVSLVAGLGWGLGLLAAYLSLLRSAWRRNDRTAVTLLLVAAAGVVAMFATTMNDPNPFGRAILTNYLRALWPTAMFVWLALALSALRTFPAALGRGTQRALPAVALALATVLGVLTIPTVDMGSGAPLWMTPLSHDLQRGVTTAMRGKGPVLVSWHGSGTALALWPTVMLALQEAGVPFKVTGAGRIQQFGVSRRFDAAHPNAQWSLIVSSDPEPAPGYRQVAATSWHTELPQAEFEALDAEVRAWGRTVTELRLDPRVAPKEPAGAADLQGRLDRLVRDARAHRRNVVDEPQFVTWFSAWIDPTRHILAARVPGIDPDHLRRWAEAVQPILDKRVYVYLAPIDVALADFAGGDNNRPLTPAGDPTARSSPTTVGK